MAATTRLSQETGTSGSTTVTNVDVNSGGTAPKFGSTDAVQSAALTIPTATGTVFAVYKNVYLDVTAADTTTISNRRVSMAASPALPTGAKLFWKSNATYAQGTQPTASGSNGATPAGFTLMTTTPTQYDGASVTANTGKNGAYLQLTAGVDFTFAGGASLVTLPQINVDYDEAA